MYLTVIEEVSNAGGDWGQRAGHLLLRWWS